MNRQDLADNIKRRIEFAVTDTGIILPLDYWREIIAALRGEPNAAGQESVRTQNPGSESLPSEPVPAAPESLPEQVQQEIWRYTTFGAIREDMEYIARLAIKCERERVLRIRRRHAVPQPEHDDERLDDPRRGQAEWINRRRG